MSYDTILYINRKSTLPSSPFTAMSSKTIARPYVDKREDDFLRAVVGCQLVPDGEEATQKWSGIGARQNHLKNNVDKLDSSFNMVNIWYIFSFISALGQ